MVHRMKHGTLPLIEDKQEERGSWTHLTFICDDSMVQTKLPQVIVGNEQLLRVQDMSCLKSQLPDNVYLVRQKSSWLNEPLFVQVLKWLLEALKNTENTSPCFAVRRCHCPCQSECVGIGTCKRTGPGVHTSETDMVAATMRHTPVPSVQELVAVATSSTCDSKEYRSTNLAHDGACNGRVSALRAAVQQVGQGFRCQWVELWAEHRFPSTDPRHEGCLAYGGCNTTVAGSQ